MYLIEKEMLHQCVKGGYEILKVTYTLDGYSSLRARYLVSYPAERITWTDSFSRVKSLQNLQVQYFDTWGPLSPKPPSGIF